MSTAIAAARAKTRGKRMLREALEGYGEDEFTLSEWNAKKKLAVEQGKWMWKQAMVDKTQAIKGRIEKNEGVKDAMKERFVDVSAAMEQEMHGDDNKTIQDRSAIGGGKVPDCCEWRERVGGKQYRCTNTPATRKASHADDGGSSKVALKRVCLWHTRECYYRNHPIEVSGAIEIPNEFGFCLACYEATAVTERKTLQRLPPRVVTINIPGVCRSDEKSVVRRELLFKNPSGGTSARDGNGMRLTASSICCWQQEHFEVAYVWRCSNCVLMHPTLKGSYLPFCGFHAQRCIRDYGRKRNKAETCPPIDRRNTFGLCRNHLEAHLSELNFEARGAVVLVDSEFNAPGVKECRKETVAATIKRHPLAPKKPPPGSTSTADRVSLGTVVLAPEQSRTKLSAVSLAISSFLSSVTHALVLMVSQVILALLNHTNPVSAFVKEAIWRFQFLRRASVVAIRIQRIFRGNRARRRTRYLRYELAALRRMAATRVIQRIARGFIGRRRFDHEFERVEAAVPNIQRILRGGLARLRCRKLRAALLLQRNYRWYRQRILAWNIREEVAYMCRLQKQANENLRTLEQQLTAFRRIRARRVLRSRIQRWRQEKEARKLEAARRIQMLLAAVKVQRKWRSHRRYQEIKKRYTSAQIIQKRLRGWLTRHMWRGDPGILLVVGFVNSCNGFEYGKTILLPLVNQSYAVPTRRIRMSCAALVIQRSYRGHFGRLRANATWAAMLKRWEWIGITPDPADSGSGSNDSMSIGRERYGIVLPSYGYHRDIREHMRPVMRMPVITRGHAYKYQYILDLIKDRDSNRAWSMDREQKWLRTNGRVQQKSTLSPALSSSSSFPNSQAKFAIPGMAPIESALYPIGTVVDVAQLSRADTVMKRAMEIDFARDHSRPKLRRGKVLRVNIPVSIDEKPTIDIEYTPTGKVEIRVALSRVSHAVFGITKPLPKPKKPVGKCIEAAIERLKFELLEKDQFFVPLPEPSDPAPDTAGTLPSIEAIAQRLADTRRGRDLLVDHAKFVDFVVRNSKMLELKWLDAVDLVRRGHLYREERSNDDTLAKPPQHPALRVFKQEFGIIDQPSNVKRLKLVNAMAERADEIEQRMIELGFQRGQITRALNEKDETPDDEEKKHQQRERPKSRAPASSFSSPNASISKTRDDIEAQHMSKNLTAQALHNLIYELKTLPRQRKRERIIEVTARNARSFICGHPACGHCFSSKEAARIHQKATHEGKPRLAYAAPLADQYLHGFWPSQTPWTEHDKPSAAMVGYFPCSQPKCTREFRTRRELHRHLELDHDVKLSSPTRQLQPVQPSGASLAVEQLVAIWLGSFTLFRSLGEKLEVPWGRFENCPAHGVARNFTCESCRVLLLLPTSPCRCYESVALYTSAGNAPVSTLSEDCNQENQDADVTIISTLDEGFGVAIDADTAVLIRARDGVAMRIEKDNTDSKNRYGSPRRRRRSKSRVDPYDSPKEVVFVHVLALCRDSKNEGWVAGHPFVPANPQMVEETTGGKSNHWTFTADDSAEIEVILDLSRVVVSRLKSSVGLTVIRDIEQSDAGLSNYEEVPSLKERAESKSMVETNTTRNWSRFELHRIG